MKKKNQFCVHSFVLTGDEENGKCNRNMPECALISRHLLTRSLFRIVEQIATVRLFPIPLAIWKLKTNEPGLVA